MPNIQNNPTRFKNGNIRNRLAAMLKKYGIPDALRQILHNEIEKTARYWYLAGGGKEEDFEKLFNQ